MMYTLFVGLIVLASILMVVIVVIQESKGGGLASNFSSSNAIMGVRKTTDVIEKTTWGLAIFMVVLSVACAYVVPRASFEQSVLEKTATETQTTNPNTTPGFGASEQQAPAAGSQNTTPANQGTQQAPATPKAPVAPAK